MIFSKKNALVLWACCVSLFMSAGLSFACAVIEPPCFDFTRILKKGDVTINPPQITFGDNGEVWSYLYSFNARQPGMYQINFDFRNALSDVSAPPPAPPFAFVDTFYATLLFRDEKTLPDCNDCYESMAMFDMDAGGVFNSAGTVSPSSQGGDWLHFRMTFENTHAYIIPGFELMDWNCVDNDSQVRLSRICISQVPLPSAFLLFVSGLAGITGLIRRRRNRMRAP